MRILHVLDHSIPLQSGYSFRTLSILGQQRAMGWETFHLTSPKHSAPYVAHEQVDGWDFYRTPPPKALGRFPVARELAEMRATAARLLEIADTARPDVVHAHSPVLNAIPALRLRARRDIPVVYEVRASWEDAAVSHGTATEGGLRYRASRALETYALKRADAIVTICEGLRRDIVARGIPSDKVTVVPNAINLTEFPAHFPPDAGLARELGLAGSVVLGFVGSFYGYEGLHLLLRALPRIRDALPQIRLVLVGGGPEERALRQLAADLGLGNAVLFTGRVHHSEVNRYYSLIDLLVFPRVPIRLTELVTPLKPLEAMAQHKIVVASDVGGHRELIDDGATGFLFRAGDVDALGAKIIEVVRRRSEWGRMGENGRRFVETERSWSKVVARYAPIYEALTGIRSKVLVPA
jgi:PEP-CTERM/exosortase A-associated glycosyltransferase